MKDTAKGALYVAASIVISVALVTGAMVYIGAAVLPGLGKPPGGMAGDEARLPNVVVRPVESETLQDAIRLTGTVIPWEQVTVSAEIGGLVEWQGVEASDAVEAGQEIYRIDTESLRVELEQAQASLTFAEQELERQQRLQREGISSPQQLQQAQSEHDVAAASVRALQVKLAKSRVVAPLAGVVDRVHAEQGEFIDRGQPLASIVQLDRVKTVLGIPEREVSAFQEGETVSVTVDALPDREFTGTIHEIAPTAEMATHTFPAEIELDNSQGLLKPGMIARARLVKASFPETIRVPMFAVISSNGSRHVFVENGGKAHKREVETGIFLGGDIQIIEGLQEGDRLIVVGQRNVRDGEPVEVEEQAP